jgi:cytosine/adenosine deaminase-related metal-dependent hydrolase
MAVFGGAVPAAGQRRFLNDPDRFLKLVERTRAVVASIPSASAAPHSLRAATPELLRTVIRETATGAFHIHVAEQIKEVDDCIAWSGRRPVQWLHDVCTERSKKI